MLELVGPEPVQVFLDALALGQPGRVTAIPYRKPDCPFCWFRKVVGCWNLPVGVGEPAMGWAVRRNVPAQRVRPPDRARDRAGEHAVGGWGSEGADGLAEGGHDPADDLHVDLKRQHHEDRGEGGGEAAAGVGTGVL